MTKIAGPRLVPSAKAFAPRLFATCCWLTALPASYGCATQGTEPGGGAGSSVGTGGSETGGGAGSGGMGAAGGMTAASGGGSGSGAGSDSGGGGASGTTSTGGKAGAGGISAGGAGGAGTAGTGGSDAGSGGAGVAGTGSGRAGGGGVVATCTPAQPHAAGTTTVNMQHGGRARAYVLHVPATYDGTKRVPLVFDIHGYTSWAIEQLQRSKWDDLAEEEGFIVIAPDGVSMSWNAGSCCGTAQSQNVDDVGFIRAVVEKASAELCIDPKRVYASGHSNGGMMTYALACQAADLFAAVAPVCGISMSPGPCVPSRPIPVLAIRALEDGTVPYSSAAADVSKWVGFNSCAATPVEPSHNGVCTTYTSCAAGTQVMECHPHGGHGFFYKPNENTDNIWVPDTAWPFFEQFSLP